MGALVKIPTIIIDDEALIRSLIRKSVDWEALGFTIVAEADNSEDALRLVREMEILLAVVDINIPFINGLQLSKQLRQINSNLSIIILTGYEEFSYAQEAIRIGVSNYLLKPLNVKELKNSLKQVHLQIVERQQDDFIETLCSQLSLEGVLKAKEEFLRILIKQSNLIPLSTLQKGAQLFGLNLTDDSVRFFQLYVIQVTEVEARGRLIDHLRLSHFEKTFPLLLHTTIDYENRPLIMAFHLDSDEAKCKEISHEIALSVRHQIAVDLKVRCSIGVGSLVKSGTEIADSYKSGAKALNMRFYTAQQRVYVYDEVPDFEERIDNRLSALFDSKQLLMMLRGGAEHELLSVVREAACIMERQLLHQNQCKILFSRYLHALEMFLTEQKLTLAQVIDQKEDVYTHLNSLDTLASIKSCIELLTVTVLVNASDNGKTRTHFIVMQAKRFIEKYSGNNAVSLDTIAEHVQVSPCYLSSIFKKIFGVSIVSYMTDYRVAKAKQLIDLDPFLTIGEVAEAVGYNDSFYFSKVFAKREGESPTAYIKRKSGFFEIVKNSYNS